MKSFSASQIFKYVIARLMFKVQHSIYMYTSSDAVSFLTVISMITVRDKQELVSV